MDPRIAMAIIIQAVRDLCNPQEKEDAKDFLNSKYFEELADTAELNPDWVRYRIKINAYDTKNKRAAYR